MSGKWLDSEGQPLTRFVDNSLPSLLYMRSCSPPGIVLRRLTETFRQPIRSEGAQARRTWYAISSTVPTSIRGACHSTIRVPLDLRYLTIVRLLPT